MQHIPLWTIFKLTKGDKVLPSLLDFNSMVTQIWIVCQVKVSIPALRTPGLETLYKGGFDTVSMCVEPIGVHFLAGIYLHVCSPS